MMIYDGCSNPEICYDNYNCLRGSGSVHPSPILCAAKSWSISPSTQISPTFIPDLGLSKNRMPKKFDVLSSLPHQNGGFLNQGYP